MKRINVSFYDEVYEELEKRTDEKRSISMAHSVRELVDLGLRIERAAAENNSQESESNELNLIMESIKNMMRFSLESLLISRKMVLQSKLENQGEAEQILKDCKLQAINLTRKLFSETGEITK